MDTSGNLGSNPGRTFLISIYIYIYIIYSSYIAHHISWLSFFFYRGRGNERGRQAGRREVRRRRGAASEAEERGEAGGARAQTLPKHRLHARKEG